VKKAFIYLFLGFLLFNFSSVMLALKLLQLDAKYEMSHQLMKSSKTEKLVFHKNTFKQTLKQGSEFDWQDKRYDVVNVVYKADSVYVNAINDTREKGILHYIGKLMHQQNKKDNDASKMSTLSLLLFQAPLSENIEIIAPYFYTKKTKYYHSFNIIKVFSATKTPPPWLA